jgi:hypothetical protein
MKDLDLNTINGSLNVEIRTDGGIGIYYETDPKTPNTLMLDKEQMIKLAGWLVSWIELQR